MVLGVSGVSGVLGSGFYNMPESTPLAKNTILEFD